MGTTPKLRWMSISPALIYLLALSAGTRAQPDRGWLDNDPVTIWSRPPGFYEEGGQWYAILHARPDVRRVRLVGDFTDEASTGRPDGVTMKLSIGPAGVFSSVQIGTGPENIASISAIGKHAGCS